MPGSFQFFEPGAIDLLSWDETIRNSFNENPFAYSAWLNLTSPGWAALINKDHSIVMPLPVKKKFGLHYLVQPRFTQQLGVFSAKKIPEKIISAALQAIPKKFVKVTLQLNTDNFFEDLKLPGRPTYCITLNRDYGTLYDRYHVNHKRNIIKAKKLGLMVGEGSDAAEFVKLYKQTAGKKDLSLKPKDYTLMKNIISLNLESGNGKILTCTNTEGEIFAALFYLKSATRIINLFNFSTAAGRTNNAMALTIDHWINHFSGSKLTLDFEGSSIPSLATFYHRFGAEPRQYPIFTRKGLW
jgi:hypothetical protein